MDNALISKGNGIHGDLNLLGLLKLNGVLRQTRNSGKTCVFMCVLHTIYLLGEAKSSTPESNSGELGHD